MIRLPDVLVGRGLVDGRAEATVLHLDEPLNVWGGLDPATGCIVHRQHPQYGESVTGTVLVLTETRGSGTNAQIIAQAMANGVGPVAVVLARPDAVLVAGIVVGSLLYDRSCPTALLTETDLAALPTGARASIAVRSGTATVTVTVTVAKGTVDGH